MKLRSKIMLGTLSCLILALTISCGLMISVNKNSMLNNTIKYTSAELKRLSDQFYYEKNRIDNVDTVLVVDSVMKLLISDQVKYTDENTDYVLQSDDRMIFNNSGLNISSILELEGKESGIVSEIVHYNDEQDFLVVGQSINTKWCRYQIGIVQNISELSYQIHHLTMLCIRIGLLVSVVTAIIMFLFLKSALCPLEQLKNEADAISQGEYQRRIDVKGKDEIASFSQSFNRMAESVEQHILEVEETSEARNRMIHALAHEMRTPVTAISGYSFALRSLRMSDEQMEEALEFIDQEAKRLERLSTKLTSLVGLDTYNIELTKINLLDLKNQLSLIMKNRSEVELHIGKGEIIGDQDLIIMLITNLCDNAKKAHATKITVKVTAEGIWVMDNGKGISEKELGHVFEPFYQGDVSRNQEGFGLGLTLCQEIARLHNTTLCVESEIGKGSTFYLYNSFTTL